MASTSEKRQWLKDRGYDVGSRGKISAELEKVYAEAQPTTAPAPDQPRNIEV